MVYPVAAVRGKSANFADVTAPTYASSEVGDVANDFVVVTFSESIFSPTSDYATGVTIKVNAVTSTISSATRQPTLKIVHYDLASDVDANDTVTWEYNAALGDIEDLAANALANVSAQSTTNNVGTHWFFDNDADSGHLLTIGL